MKMKRKLHKWRIKEINKIYGMLYTSRCIAMEKKLHCGTPFLIMRNLSAFRLYCEFTFADKGK